MSTTSADLITAYREGATVTSLDGLAVLQRHVCTRRRNEDKISGTQPHALTIA